jgi:hypothetical protein
VPLVGNVSLVGSIHQLEADLQASICEARRGGFVPWELQGLDKRHNSIGREASIVVSLMRKLYMTTIRIVKIERLSRHEGVSDECSGGCLWCKVRFEEHEAGVGGLGGGGCNIASLSLFVRRCSVLLAMLAVLVVR